jgi:hypothetical protein
MNHFEPLDQRQDQRQGQRQPLGNLGSLQSCVQAGSPRLRQCELELEQEKKQEQIERQNEWQHEQQQEQQNGQVLEWKQQNERDPQ